MSTTTLTPDQVIKRVAAPLAGLPACIAGSTVAAQVYDLPMSEHSDIDVFCYSEQTLMVAIQRMLAEGFTFNDRFERVWDRWLKFGFNNWHTNSMKLEGPKSLDFVEVNLVYKLVARHPLTSLSAVLESFDFGLLGAGYDLTDGPAQFKDLRSFLFPGRMLSGALPLMPNKRDAWRQGFISQYNGLREVGRYAKYATYGHDLSAVKDDLVTGYKAAWLYLSQRDQAEKQQLGEIYFAIAEKIEADDIADLLAAGKQILNLDALDLIMEALE